MSSERGKGEMAMFEQTFVDGTGKTNKSWTVVRLVRGAVR